VVDTVLPGIVGFCVPVFDADGHLVLGITTLGSLATFDPDWVAPSTAAARCRGPPVGRPRLPRRLSPDPRTVTSAALPSSARPPARPAARALRRSLAMLSALVLAAHLLLLWDGASLLPGREGPGAQAPVLPLPVFSTRRIDVAMPAAAPPAPPATPTAPRPRRPA
jgi:hypothetical protein